MGAVEYLKQKENSQKFLDTVNHNIVAAYLAAVNTTIDENGQLNLAQLEEETNANKATDLAYQTLVKHALKASNSTASDEFTQTRLVFATFGVTKRTLGEYFRGTKGRKPEERNVSNFFGTIAQTAPAFRYVQNMYGQEIPLQSLSIEEKEKLDLLKYLGITDEEMRKKLANKISDTATLASLIDAHKENDGELPKRSLDDILKAA